MTIIYNTLPRLLRFSTDSATSLGIKVVSFASVTPSESDSRFVFFNQGILKMLHLVGHVLFPYVVWLRLRSCSNTAPCLRRQFLVEDSRERRGTPYANIRRHRLSESQPSPCVPRSTAGCQDLGVVPEPEPLPTTSHPHQCDYGTHRRRTQVLQSVAARAQVQIDVAQTLQLGCCSFGGALGAPSWPFCWPFSHPFCPPIASPSYSAGICATGASRGSRPG